MQNIRWAHFGPKPSQQNSLTKKKVYFNSLNVTVNSCKKSEKFHALIFEKFENPPFKSVLPPPNKSFS